MCKVSILAALGLVTTLQVSIAQTPNNQIWVSAKGADVSNCGPLATPCRTLQYAHDIIAPGGEIDVQDSAGYGALSITKPVSVIGDGRIVGITDSAITINVAVPGTVMLRNLTIDGMGLSNNSNGITYYQGSTVVIDHCAVQNFRQPIAGISGGYGLFINPTTGLGSMTITNSSFIGNRRSGITSFGTNAINMKLDNVSLIQNGVSGLDLQLGNINISNTTAAFNGTGMTFTGSANINLENVNVSKNETGIYLYVRASVYLGRSSVLGNTTEDIKINPNLDNILYTYGTNQVGVVTGGVLTNVASR